MRPFMCKPSHDRFNVVLSNGYSLYRGIILYKQISWLYLLTSEEIYRRHSCTANGGMHIYSIYHGLVLANLPTELYRRPLVGFVLNKRDLSNYLRPNAVCLSLNMSWRVSRGGGCVQVAGIAVWQCVNILSQILNCNRICDRAFTVY